ncbi:hypothetical protein ACVWZL_005864 [Bradyrhizobium sp. GM2.4]
MLRGCVMEHEFYQGLALSGPDPRREGRPVHQATPAGSRQTVRRQGRLAPCELGRAPVAGAAHDAAGDDLLRTGRSLTPRLDGRVLAKLDGFRRKREIARGESSRCTIPVCSGSRLLKPTFPREPEGLKRKGAVPQEHLHQQHDRPDERHFPAALHEPEALPHHPEVSGSQHHGQGVEADPSGVEGRAAAG